MNERVRYWVEISEYDLETAKAMLEAGRFLYVGFMCHQSIEKILKAYWQSVKKEIAPKTHNLLYLAVETGIDRDLNEEQLDFIDELIPLNIEARYPENKDLLSQKLDRHESERIYINTGRLHSWIKMKLS